MSRRKRTDEEVALASTLRTVEKFSDWLADDAESSYSKFNRHRLNLGLGDGDFAAILGVTTAKLRSWRTKGLIPLGKQREDLASKTSALYRWMSGDTSSGSFVSGSAEFRLVGGVLRGVFSGVESTSAGTQHKHHSGIPVTIPYDAATIAHETANNRTARIFEAFCRSPEGKAFDRVTANPWTCPAGDRGKMKAAEAAAWAKTVNLTTATELHEAREWAIARGIEGARS